MKRTCATKRDQEQVVEIPRFEASATANNRAAGADRQSALGSWANDPGIWVHHMFPSRGPTITGFGGALMAIDFNQKERAAVDCCSAATPNWRDDFWLRFMFAG